MTYYHSVNQISENDLSEDVLSGDELSDDSTQIVHRRLSRKDQILECLRTAGGESLSIEEISDHTSISEANVKKLVRKMCGEDGIETAEVFEDENVPGSYFLTEALLDRLAI